MTTRMVQGLALALGAGALATAALVQQAIVSPASTVQAGTHAAAVPQPIGFGLIPPQHNAHKTKPATGANTLYDYVNPCLIPLDEIRKITSDNTLKFDGMGNKMTTNVADARPITLADTSLPPVCAADPGPGYVKPVFFVGVKTQQSTEGFMSLRKHWDDSYWNAQDVEVNGLPSAREAFAMYAPLGNKRAYVMLFVHTKYDQTLVVKWSGTNAHPAMPVLRQLAYEALRTLTGSRYPGK